jgi:hypothetical protein
MYGPRRATSRKVGVLNAYRNFADVGNNRPRPMSSFLAVDDSAFKSRQSGFDPRPRYRPVPKGMSERIDIARDGRETRDQFHFGKVHVLRTRDRTKRNGFESLELAVPR